MSSAAKEDKVLMAAKLYECRNAARKLLGEYYQHDMALWARVIRGEAEANQRSDLAAAIKLAGERDAFGSIVVLAAFVEMTEPSDGKPPESAGASRKAGQ